MADNVVANPGAGGATFASFQQVTTGVEWAASIPAFLTGGSAGAWTMQAVLDQDGDRLPIKPIGPIGAVTDAGITLAGVDATLLAAATRRVLWIWNPVTETETLYINFGGAAAADNHSIPLDPGAMLVMQSPQFVSNEAVHAFAVTNGHKVGCKWA